MDKHYFLFQVDHKSDLIFDFQFTLLNVLRWNSKIDKNYNFDYIYYEVEDGSVSLDKHDKKVYKNNVIPVGSVEFVTSFIEQVHGKRIRPLNVPKELRDFKFSKRWIYEAQSGEMISAKKFVKSAEKFKSEPVITTKSQSFTYDTLVSDLISINSEWRVFISNGQVRGIKNYAGDFYDLPPSREFVESCIKAYTQQPAVWTLDIGRHYESEFVIECHDFFSCGLYGFSSKNLPTMFSQWFYQYVKNV